MKAKYVPNILSVVRIISAFVFMYLFLNEYYIISFAVFIFAGLTDVADGILARHFDWITPLGKILDPIADKLVQCVALFCLTIKNFIPSPYSYCVLLFFIIKELLMLSGAILLFRKKREIGVSKYFGKAAAVLFYAAIGAIIIFQDELSPEATVIICALVVASAVAAIIMYFTNYIAYKGVLKRQNSELDTNKAEPQKGNKSW